MSDIGIKIIPLQIKPFIVGLILGSPPDTLGRKNRE
jgi:hypothetical protein